MTVVLGHFDSKILYQQTWNHDFFVSVIKLLTVISTATKPSRKFFLKIHLDLKGTIVHVLYRELLGA